MTNFVLAVVAVAGVVIIVNVAIAATSAAARRTRRNEPLPAIVGVKHLHAADGHLWRSSAPSRDAFRELAKRGVRTVVDLRAERHLRNDEAALADLGVDLVRLPIRDGQTPTRSQVETALTAIRSSAGITLVHCGAGVGRTGSVVGAYLVITGAAPRSEALLRNLAVGPPSLEQVWYVARLGPALEQPNAVIKVVSRVLDAPRRIWSRIRGRRRSARGSLPDS